MNTRRCGSCGKLGVPTIVETGNVAYSCPVQYERVYQCVCGAKEPAPPRIGEGIRILNEAEGRALRPELYGSREP